jgi:hypothetical protein
MVSRKPHGQGIRTAEIIRPQPTRNRSSHRLPVIWHRALMVADDRAHAEGDNAELQRQYDGLLANFDNEEDLLRSLLDPKGTVSGQLR